jgi:hypothetical protein
MKTIFRAYVYAYAAIDTGKGITCPGGGLFIHRDALGRAFSGTDTAEPAFFDIIVKGAPDVVKRRSNVLRIVPGRFVRE